MEAYERIRILGKGSYGQAWLVRHRVTKDLCVMKDMQPRNDQELTEAVSGPLYFYFQKAINQPAHPSTAAGRGAAAQGY